MGWGWGWPLGLSSREGLKRGLPAAADSGLWDGVRRRSRARRDGRPDKYFFQDGESQGENETLATPLPQGNSCFPLRCQDPGTLKWSRPPSNPSPSPGGGGGSGWTAPSTSRSPLLAGCTVEGPSPPRRKGPKVRGETRLR
uniref:Uncharacterized protein n=1 Tax=Rousettus aegyptiacus TaxID=9407 RepID=A0A7J8KAR3_ROUAE|nr:hypothetical protein HJG63_007824 [Rousettus aegyptiacus]